MELERVVLEAEIEFEGEEMVAAEVERSNKEVERDIEVEIDLGKMMRDMTRSRYFFNHWVSISLDTVNAADALARSATVYKDRMPDKTHTLASAIDSERRTTAWTEWFNQKQHLYVRKSKRKFTHLRNLDQRDAATIFRLRTNKGWNPGTPSEQNLVPPRMRRHS